MMIGGTKCNSARSIPVEDFSGAEAHEADADPMGSPLGSPAVQAIPRQDMIV